MEKLADYRNPELAVATRVADLVRRMTLAEKAVQIGSVLGSDLVDERGLRSSACDRLLHLGVGQISQLASSAELERSRLAALTNELQTYLINNTRLGIPALIHEECASGFPAADGTLFPQPLGLAASWNPDLVREIGRMIAWEMRLSGVHLGLSPVLDIARDPRWQHIGETYGEDPFLTSAMGLAMVEGLQHGNDGSGVVASVKHFVGQAATRQHRPAWATEIPRRQLVEVFMAPFEQAVRFGRAGSMMHASGNIDGVPTTANKWLLTHVLRDLWGFAGTVVSEYNAVEALHTDHETSADLESAAATAINAGVDVELPETKAFGRPLLMAVKSGEVDETTLDRAVARVLRQKFELGLFEHHLVDPSPLIPMIAAPQRLARRAADTAAVLLKNDGAVLPLCPKATSIALIGPASHSAAAFLGAPLMDDRGDTDDSFAAARFPSLLECFRERSLDVTYAAGGSAAGVAETDAVQHAVEIAQASDVAVVVLGGRTQSSCSAQGGGGRSMSLPTDEQRLLRAVASTSTPVVLVLLSGQPYTLPWAAEHIPAIVWSVLPGQAGARSLTSILLGEIEPTGRLPTTLVRHAGQIPMHYGNVAAADLDLPLWPFGFGLGYTSFAIDNVACPSSANTADDAVRIGYEVKNIGDRRGTTVVQCYVGQTGMSVRRPAQALVSFDRVELAPGERAWRTMTVPMTRLGLIDQAYQRVIEPGMLSFSLGFSSADIVGETQTQLRGATVFAPVPAPARILAA